MKRIFQLLIALVMVFGLSAQAHATLTTIGTATYSVDGLEYNLIYDDDLNITWLDYRKASNDWGSQVGWAGGLNTGGVLTYNLDPGVTVSWTGDWRLPETMNSPWDYGYNITTSEMGHLFYTELGNLGYEDTSGDYVGDGNYGLLNTGDFLNLYNGPYWSGTPYDFDFAWYFRFYDGGQRFYYKTDKIDALAVRSGVVSIASVPEPSTMLLLGSGLVALGLVRRRFKA